VVVLEVNVHQQIELRCRLFAGPLASMKKPELKYLLSIELEDGQLPEDPEDCSIFVEANIGLQDEEGSDIFSFYVVTPKALQQDTPRWGRGLLIVNRFSWETVETSIKKLLRHCNGDDWEEIASELNKRLHWEFDNYKEHEG